MKLTIIIPVYKVEKYIRRCLSSIFNQGLNDMFEVIVVNDGTPDNSIVTVNEFARQYDNLVLINQCNQGLSVARNTGLARATGEYIWFVDSDDSISEGSLRYLINYISNNTADVIGFDMLAIWESGEREQRMPIVISPQNSDLYGHVLDRRSIIHKIHTAAVQRFVFRRSFIEKHDLRFLPNIIHEDVDFMGRALFYAQIIRIEKEILYHYLQRTSGSIMATLDMRSIESRHAILQDLNVFSLQNVSSFSDKIFMYDYMLKTLLQMLGFGGQEIKENVLRFIKRNSSFYKKIAWHGVIANVILLNLKKVIRGLIIALNPTVYFKLYTRNR